jgi:hypothetical protein
VKTGIFFAEKSSVVPISRKEHMESNPNLIRLISVPFPLEDVLLFGADMGGLGPLASKLYLLNKPISTYWRKKQMSKAVRRAAQLDLVISFELRMMM